MKIDPEYQDLEIKDMNEQANIDEKSETATSMLFLKECDFLDKDILAAENKTPLLIAKQIDESSKLVKANVSFLKDLGVKNYKDVFINYSDMFLMDHSNFKSVFLKYDKEDLIDKILKNVAIVEHL